MRGGDLVVEARRRVGLTQRELAGLGGTTQSAIARLEGGRTNPSFDQVARLLRLCGFRLAVALDQYDTSDLAQAELLIDMSPEERLHHLEQVVEALERLRSEAGLAG
jgi:predicted transcriptional regulator